MPPITPTPIGIKQFFTTLLADYLGKYKYPNGYVTPAIYIGNPPNNIVAEGLEVILPLMPDQDTYLIAANFYKETNYEIYLIQRSGVNQIPNAVEAITSYCWKTKGYFVPQLEPNSSFVSYRLQISINQLIESLAYVG